MIFSFMLKIRFLRHTFDGLKSKIIKFNAAGEGYKNLSSRLCVLQCQEFETLLRNKKKEVYWKVEGYEL